MTILNTVQHGRRNNKILKIINLRIFILHHFQRKSHHSIKRVTLFKQFQQQNSHQSIAEPGWQT